MDMSATTLAIACSFVSGVAPSTTLYPSVGPDLLFSTSSRAARLSKVATMRPDDHVIVIAGATGDLAKRKLLPGLCHLDAAKLLPEDYRIIGSAPGSEAMSDEQFRDHTKDAVIKFGNRDASGDQWDAFI